MAPPVPLFLAVASGPRYIPEIHSTVGAWDPMVSIHELGASIMGPNVEMLRAEASATIDGMKASIWTGTFLDYTVSFAVNPAKLMYIKCVFALGDVLPLRPTSNPFTQMMADPRLAPRQLYWPNPYPDSQNKIAVREIANSLILTGSNKMLQGSRALV